jgi:low temperature requirement protein LtrA
VTGGVAAPAGDAHTEPLVSADPVELFFDLAFVFALARLVGFIHDDLSAVTLLRALVLFALLWWAWSQFTWAANAVGTSTRGVRVVMLAATVATVPLGAAIPAAYEQAGVVFALSWCVLLLAGLAVYLVGVRRDAGHLHAVRHFARRSLPGVVLVLAGAFVPDPARTILWALGFVALAVAAALSASAGFRIVPSHFAERYGLIVIVALGETVVAVGIGVGSRATEVGVVASLVAGGVLASSLWWAYFDHTAPAAEARLHATPVEARGPVARDVYTYLHLPVAMGIVLVAVALEEVVAHPGDPLALAVRGVLAAGLLLFLGGLVAIEWRAVGRVRLTRPAALAALVLLSLVLTGLAGLVVIAVVDVVLLAALVADRGR